jgi:hypothetical protein
MVILTDKIIDEEFRKLIEEKKEKGELITTIQRNGRYLLEDGCVYSLHIGDEVIGIATEVNPSTIVVEWRDTPPTTTVMQRIEEFNNSLAFHYEQESEQNNAQRDYINTLQEHVRAMREHVLPPVDGFYYEHDDIYGSEKDTTHKERKCWVCEKPIYFNEFLHANPCYITTEHGHRYEVRGEKSTELKEHNEQLEKQWESDIVEIACCNCFKTLEAIIYNNQKFKKIRTIRIELIKCYHLIKEPFQQQTEKEIKRISIFYNANVIGVDCTQIQLKNLVDKGFIDIDPSVLKELLGGSE